MKDEPAQAKKQPKPDRAQALNHFVDELGLFTSRLRKKVFHRHARFARLPAIAPRRKYSALQNALVLVAPN
ncbi:MAG: hypothetical protein WA005_00725 [Candidatus Binataceae bacterium]